MAAAQTHPVNVPVVAQNKFSNVFKAFNTQVKGIASGVGKMNAKMLQSSAIIGQKGHQLKKTGQSMRSFGKSATVGVTAPLVAMAAVSIKAFADMEKGMKNVASLGVADERIKSLTKDVDKMTVTFAKSSQDMTNGLYEIVSAFGDLDEEGNDSTTKLRINAEAAAAGLATTQESIKLTSAVTKAYGDTTNKAVQQVADMAFKTVELGQTTFPELAAAITKVTSKSNELGVNQKGLFGVMATATGVTGNAAEVSTQLGAVLNALSNPTKEMTALYKKMGVEGGKGLIEKQGGLAQTMKLIVDNVKKTKKPMKDFIGQTTGQTLALALAGPQYDNLIKKTKAMESAQGSAAKAFKKQSESFAFQSAQLKQELLSVGRDVGEILVPVLLDLMKIVKPIIKSFKEASPTTKKLIVVLGGIAAAVGPAILALGTLVSTVGTLMTGYAAAVPMIMAFGAKISLVWGGITGIIGTVVTAFTGFISGIPAFLAAFNPIGLAIGVFTASFTSALFVFNKLFTALTQSDLTPQFVKTFAQDWLNGFSVMKEVAVDFIKWFGELGLKAGKLFIQGITAPIQSAINVGGVIGETVSNFFGADEQETASRPAADVNNALAQNVMTQRILQEQNVNVNFGNMPQGTSVESTGDQFAMLNMGSTQ